MTRRQDIATARGARLLPAAAVPAAAQADFGLDPGSVIDHRAKPRRHDRHPGRLPPLRLHRSLRAEDRRKPARPKAANCATSIVDLPPGLVGNPQAVPRCPRQTSKAQPQCRSRYPGRRPARGPSRPRRIPAPSTTSAPPPGVAAQLGFSVASLNALEYASVRSEEGYGLRVGTSTSRPKSPRSPRRSGGCRPIPATIAERAFALSTVSRSKAALPTRPCKSFLTLPASCDAPPQTTVKTDSKQNPGVFDEQSALSLDGGGNPAALAGCDGVPSLPDLGYPDQQAGRELHRPRLRAEAAQPGSAASRRDRRNRAEEDRGHLARRVHGQSIAGRGAGVCSPGPVQSREDRLQTRRRLPGGIEARQRSPTHR